MRGEPFFYEHGEIVVREGENLERRRGFRVYTADPDGRDPGGANAGFCRFTVLLSEDD